MGSWLLRCVGGTAKTHSTTSTRVLISTDFPCEFGRSTNAPRLHPKISVEIFSGGRNEIGSNVPYFGLISRAYKHAERLANP